MVAWVMARAVDILESNIISGEEKRDYDVSLLDGIDEAAIAK